MRFLVVDDERIMLNKLVETLHRIRGEGVDILPFTWPEDALKAAAEYPVDVAFLDIQMGGMTGLQLAARLKKIKSDTHIIFVTGYHEYAVDAFAIHATGYLLKPITEEVVKRELTFLYGEPKDKSHIKIKTFGGFDVYVNGQSVKFGRAKAKELLAYLVDRRGSTVTTSEVYATLFEDAEDTQSGKSYLRTILHELKKALTQAGAEEILVKSHNSYAIVPDKFDCDFYRFLEGDPIAVNQYQNDYLLSYSWAEARNAELGFRHP